jgi:membrane protein CcdC involved in cytochrome C biogenesis
VALVIAALILAVWCGVTALRNKPTDDPHLYGIAVAEVLLLVQVAIVIVRLAQGDRPAEFATFLAYLILTPFVLPIGFLLSLVERTRWGSVILGIAALTLAVLVVRLQDLWGTIGG